MRSDSSSIIIVDYTLGLTISDKIPNITLWKQTLPTISQIPLPANNTLKREFRKQSVRKVYFFYRENASNVHMLGTKPHKEKTKKYIKKRFVLSPKGSIFQANRPHKSAQRRGSHDQLDIMHKQTNPRKNFQL